MVTKGVSERVQVTKKTEVHTHVVGEFSIFLMLN